MKNELTITDFADHQLAIIREGGEVTTDDHYRQIERIAREARVMMKQSDAQMAPEIKQAHDLHKSLVAKRKEIHEPLNQIISTAGKLLGAYNAKREAEARVVARAEAKTQAKLAAAELVEAGEVDAAMSAIETAETMPDSALEVVDTKPVNIGTMTRTTYEIEIDPGKLPKSWMMPDEKKIRAAVNKAKGDITIKGVTITPVTKTHVQ
jgi:hypothetical protein